jgi:hypothetical protein
MCLQLADLSLCHPEGILNDVCLGVGCSYVAADFVVVETGGNENAPIILGRPFFATAKAVIYANAAKIIFAINGRKEIQLQEQDLKSSCTPLISLPSRTRASCRREEKRKKDE